jgi:hypothetical protein
LSAVLETEEEERLRMSVEMSLAEIATFDSILIKQITVPVLIGLLPDFSSMKADSNTDIVLYKLTLKTIQKLCVFPSVYAVAEQDLLNKFLYICGHSKLLSNSITNGLL